MIRRGLSAVARLKSICHVRRAGVFLAPLVFLAGPLSAAKVVGYDIENATTSGFGGWRHTYNGTVTPNGRTNYLGGTQATYANGGGTLNDGVLGDTSATQLFATFEGVRTGPQPIITVYLDAFYLLDSISLWSLGTNFGNVIPGNITAADINLGGVRQRYETIGFGPKATEQDAYLLHDRIDLQPTHTQLAIDRFSISGFSTEGRNVMFMAIGEIEVNGEFVRPLPEPSTWAMLIIGFGVIGGGLRKNRRHLALA